MKKLISSRIKYLNILKLYLIINFLILKELNIYYPNNVSYEFLNLKIKFKKKLYL